MQLVGATHPQLAAGSHRYMMGTDQLPEERRGHDVASGEIQHDPAVVGTNVAQAGIGGRRLAGGVRSYPDNRDPCNPSDPKRWNTHRRTSIALILSIDLGNSKNETVPTREDTYTLRSKADYFSPSFLNSKRRGMPPFMNPIDAVSPPSAERSYTIRCGES